ncbi:MAG: hypothetical protein PWP23_1926 [Candidatus Sumerlaeota bacterium]|nr:hypothetical protein [Candidatus Sumerlaeota bacterium]
MTRVFLLHLVFAALLVEAPVQCWAQPGNEPLIAHVRELASPAYGGRLAGSAGERRAAAWLVGALERLGARPLPGAEGFLSRFPLPADGGMAINVAGWLPPVANEDEAATAGLVLLGAHYDGVGDGLAIHGAVRAGRRGPLHPGADDNASGVAVVLGAAGRLVADPGRRRGVVIVFWSGEEWGLAGSRAFAQAWDFQGLPLERVIVADMVGRLRDAGALTVEAAGPAAWRTGIEETAGRLGVPLAWVEPGTLSTDVRSFDAAGVPRVAFTTGKQAEYESPADTAETIDAGGLERLAALAAALADAGEVPGTRQTP